MDESLRQAALEYHRLPTAGKISVTPTKALVNQRDLALAYSPGVAAACDAIVADPGEARTLTSRGNLVAVVTNGTAVLGLGNIGPLAGKPVMEGKACLFKKFAGIDVFDIELDENDPDELVKTIARLEPTFGGINLEDIKAPDCFYVEKKLRERMKIPVFHDDQHGTAIVAGAAILNGLKVVDKDIAAVKLVCSGAGAAAIACLDLLVGLGLRRENVVVCDSKGVIFTGRESPMEENKARYARATNARTLADAIQGADIFLGLSGPGVLKQEMVRTMARDPLILALANPEPEILPDVAKAVRPDAILATGRSDYPNQVNNVLCFPFMFRGALDVGATTITEAMKLACVRAIAELAHAELSDIVAQAYAGEALSFGPEYLIPKPFDPRLMVIVPPAVARAAMDDGVATRPIADFDAYRERLSQFVYHSGLIMKPVFAHAKAAPKRVLYAEGEDERVLRAVQVVIDEGLARPILVGRPEVIAARIEKFGLRLAAGRDFELVNINSDPRYRACWQLYYQLMSRNGIAPEEAKEAVLRKPTLIGMLLLRMGECDAVLCGPVGKYQAHLRHVADVIGQRADAPVFAAMNGLLLPDRTLFISDTHVNRNPSAERLVAITQLAADAVRRFGLVPKVALMSHSNFGSDDSKSARKMRKLRRLLEERAPGLEVDGEMHGDAALSEAIRSRVHPDSTLKGEANLLIMPNLDAANISFNLLKITSGEGVNVGPILLGADRPVLIATASATVRRLVNLTALAIVDAGSTRTA
ncbi:MAG: NADP-dependent malic enzyme [Betaproteobacteria bacterium]|jgi:malate dehydrogenase (oxaloacetate-decarboxylating)(NADP+)|nr:NADP-dependent malic enzyme [Betaproteobacteria bacterium]MBK7590949.1 NADP-dependent malic enzyme [Betaproteobacteria bacterium]